MLGVLIQILQFIAALSLLVILHEGGHFFFAKLFKTRVEKFYLFFDFLFPFSNILPFSIWKKKKGDTEYGIGWFPLGGYVKIAGMVDESMDKDQLAKPPQPWEFRSKKAWQRLLIMLGGIIVNLLTAYIIYIGILVTWGEKRTPISILNNGIEVVDTLGSNIGFKDGDKIIGVDGNKLEYYEDLRKEIFLGNVVNIERGGQNIDLTMPIDLADKLSKSLERSNFFIDIPTPVIIDSIPANSNVAKSGFLKNDKIVSVNGLDASSYYKFSNLLATNINKEVSILVDRNGQSIIKSITVNAEGKLGIGIVTPNNETNFKRLYGVDMVSKDYNLFQAIPAAFSLATDKVSDYFRQFKVIFNPETKAYKQVGGFISMGKIYPKTWNWFAFWNITAFISIALAIMNLLPIPGLDGGHVIFILWEMITGKKPGDKFMEVVTTIGLLLILSLMLLTNGNDIIKLINSYFS